MRRKIVYIFRNAKYENIIQINLSLVCRHWHQIVLALRHFHRKHLTRKKVRLESRTGKAQRYTFDRHVYIRLPVAGSLNDWGK